MDYCGGPSTRQNFDRGGSDIGCSRHQGLHNVDQEELAPKPHADKFLDHESTNSELDEVEVDEEDNENDDEVGDSLMLDVLCNNAEGTSSQQEEPINITLPSTTNAPSLYPIIPFFATTHPEIPADSIDIPTCKWSKFYDSTEGELEAGMVFKSKAHLQASVQDFSV